MKNTALRRGAFLIAMALALAGCGKEAAPPQRGPTPVTVVTLTPESVTLTQELPGRASPFLVAEVRPQVTGIVADRLFTEGGMVEMGEPLYQLDDATYQAEVNNQKARLKRAEATLASARLAAKRASGLVDIEAVSQQEYEDATAALAQAEADVAAARAALDSATVTLNYATITAPIAGRIGRSSVTRGALVTANQADALVTIQQLDPMYVDVTQSSKELLELRQALSAGRLKAAEDLPVTLRLEDGSTYPHEGRLAFSEVTVDPTTGSFVLRVVVDNPDQLLLPGMYVRAVVGTGIRPDAILVPQRAVTRNAKGQASVMLVNSDGKAEQRVIDVDRTVGDRWLVDSGLSAGDRVIVAGLQKIRPGAPVAAEEAGSEPASKSQ